MTAVRDILLKLVRLAMDWDCDYTLPEIINWKEVLKYAKEQGVEAIVLDGYRKFLSKNPDVVNDFIKPETELLLLAAYGRSLISENKNRKQQTALLKLSEILEREKIPFLIMKGFACGQYYPNPLHRSCGDIDIYPGDKFNESNQALRSSGIDVDDYYYRHSASTINEVNIENHKILCDLRGPKDQTLALEAQLEAEGKKSITNGKDVVVNGVCISGAKFPTANFNVLFLPWHVSAHFEFERVTIRHLLDWALFLTNEGKEIDIEMFREAKRMYTFGYSKFADLLTNLSLRYLMMPVGNVPSGIIEDANNFDDQLANKVFDYMFVGQPRERDENVWKFRWNNIRRVWNERWKYKELYGVSVMGFIYYKVKGVLFKVGEHE